MIYHTPTPEELAKAQRLADDDSRRLYNDPLSVELRKEMFGVEMASELLEKIERITNE